MKRLQQLFTVCSPWAKKSIALYLLVFFLATRMFDVDKMHMRILNALLLPVDYLYCYTQGIEPFNSETFGAYVDYYKQLIRYVPYKSDALGMLAFCYYHLGDQPRAIELYKKAIKEDSTFFWFHYNLGVIHFNRGEYAEAVSALKNALNSNRQASLGFASNSRILVYLGPVVQTDTPLKKIPTQQEVYSNLTNHLKEGLAHCQEMIVLSYAQLKDYQRLLRWSRHGIEYQPREQAFFNYYAGRAAYETENYSVAVGFLNKTIELDPEYADAFRYLDLTLKAMRQDKTAMPVLMRYEELKSRFPNGRDKDRRQYALRVF